MHLIYLFQSVFTSNSYIIVHETAVYWKRVSLMRILQKYLRLRDDRDVWFVCFNGTAVTSRVPLIGKTIHVHHVCSVCTEWQSFVVRRSVADESTLRAGNLESKRSEMAHCSSKHSQSLLGMRISWNFHHPA